MMEIIILAAVIGSVIAGIWDLFTTEVPDEIPALMITFGLFFWYIMASFGDMYSLFISLTVGILVLIFGLVLYKKGHWGGADAWLLAAIAFMIPLFNGQIFMIGFIFNLLIVGSVYMVIYVLILGLKHKHIFSHYKEDLKQKKKFIIGIPALFALFIIMISSMTFFYFGYINIGPLLLILLLIIGLTLFWRYGVVVEKYIFKKTIHVKDLKVGDVLVDTIWVGLEKEDIERIKQKGGEVTIKEGVRFIPAYPITLIVTLLFGNLFLLVPGFL